MTIDPFRPPETPRESLHPSGALGRIDIGAAISNGWALTRQSFVTWLRVAILGFLMVGLATALFVVPVLVVGPLVLFGLVRFHLEAFEGRGEVKDLFSGFSEVGTALAGFLVLGLVSALVSLPGQSLSVAGEALESPILSLASIPVSLAVSLITLRWAFAPFFIVDQRMGGLDAIRASWRVTQGQFLNLLLLAIASAALAFLGALALLIGIFPAAAVIYFAYTTAYRQLVGAS